MSGARLLPRYHSLTELLSTDNINSRVLSFRPDFEDFILFQDFLEQFCNIYFDTKICKIKINFMRMRTDKTYQREKLSTIYFTV